MDRLLQANPEECASLVRTFEAKGERYQGFCRGGDADGHGELEGKGDRYAWCHIYTTVVQKSHRL
jgi:hypothetical protein